MKVGLFGGTFDPPHNGHLEIARAAIRAFSLSKLIFIPANVSPTKTSEIHTSPAHRLMMLKLALQNEPDCEISTIEIERGGLSYSIDTIRAIKHQMRLECKDLFFVVGADSLIEFHKWRQPEDILQEVQVVVARRPGCDLSLVKPEYLAKVLFFNAPLIPFSSSDIRQIAKNGGQIDELVPPAVAEYIRQNELYRRSA